MPGVMSHTWPYMAVILLQLGYAGQTIIAKSALDGGMSPFTFVVYRHILASSVLVPLALLMDRGRRPSMTPRIFAMMMLLGFLEPILDQGLYFTGLKLTSATYASAMCNTLPSLAFVLAFLFGMERVNMREIRSIAKVVGTLVSVSGAMTMTLWHGPAIAFPWSREPHPHRHAVQAPHRHAHGGQPLLGSTLVFLSCIGWASFIVFQAFVLREYPAEMSVAALICALGAVQGGLVAAVVTGMSGNGRTVWSLHWDMTLVSIVYSGVVCSGAAYYLQGLVVQRKGPVFVSAFIPLSMVVVAVMGVMVLSEQLNCGRAVGAAIIVVGLYSVLWGMRRDRVDSQLPTSGRN